MQSVFMLAVAVARVAGVFGIATLIGLVACIGIATAFAAVVAIAPTTFVVSGDCSFHYGYYYHNP